MPRLLTLFLEPRPQGDKHPPHWPASGKSAAGRRKRQTRAGQLMPGRPLSASTGEHLPRGGSDWPGSPHRDGLGFWPLALVLRLKRWRFSQMMHPLRKSDPPADYATAYQMAAVVARRQSLSQLRQALCVFTPPARSEFEWGAVDALADELRDRGETIPVL